ncbi:Rne/Rng family ribonuclease [Gulosibacter sediminis]|uniref:Rne/Rng family ribonuclease n=1 Tax=Gulosibacter sediminis TaxID=1729695 RepID=UPI0024ADB8A7|nr:Rne/Rng family ribonuclease [Gulosibacter sediminis]
MTVDNHNNDSNNSNDEANQIDDAAQPQAEATSDAVDAASTDTESQPAADAESNEGGTAADVTSDDAKGDADAAATEAADSTEASSADSTDPAKADVAESDDAAAVADDSAKADDTDKADDAAKTDDAKPEDERHPRIPEVITQRTLFFLAPDLPPLPEAPRSSRNEPREPQQRDDANDEDGDDNESNSNNRRRTSRRGRRGDEQEREQREPQRRERDRDRDRSRDSGRDSSDFDDDTDAEVIDEPQAVKGSTRLAAKRARRRESRELGRRRTVVTESEFQARRESVDRKMLVRAKDGRVQIGVLEDNILVEHYVARNEDVSLIGNVYLGRVQNVLPSMEAAFVDIGEARNAVLYSGEVDWSAAKLGPNTARKIENALKPGDKVLVQVTKDPVGHKGARLTSQISLPGRYLVYVPGNTLNGISRKLPETERTRLKKILKEVLPDGVGVIVRTAAEGATEEQLQRDVERLTRQWEDIQKQVASAGKGPKTLHAEPDMLIKIIRDVFNEDFHQLIIQGNSELETIKTYLGQVAPDLLERVEKYTGDDIFVEYKVNDMIDKALSRKVWLPSGGSLVIDRTEAMTVIDVNTGKFVGSGGNLEETVTKNNLEAAEEIIRQLRLRDIGGIIVIDFIDMVLETNRDLVHRRLVEGLSRDRTKHQVAEVTSLGLVQMTRKKIGLGLLETFSEPCAACAGRGVVVHSHPVNHGGGNSNQSKGRSQSRRGNNKGQNDNGRNQNQGQNQNQNQNQTQSGSNGGGTHEITDDARNALTKIAASTMVSAKDDEAVREAAEKLADAAAAAASGKPAADVLAAGGDSSNDNDSNGEGRRSRRSRRGGRGRNRNAEQQGDEPQNSSSEQAEDQRDARDSRDPGQQDASAGDRSTSDRNSSDRSANDRNASNRSSSDRAAATTTQPAQDATKAEEAPRASKPRRRRVSTGTVTADASNNEARRESARSIELPEAKEPAPKAEPLADGSLSLASLDAALDSLAGTSAEPSEPATQSQPKEQPQAAPQANAESAPAAEAPKTSSPKRRRRITTGPIAGE